MTSEKKLEQVFETLKLEQVPAYSLVGQIAGGSEFGAGWHRLADLVNEEHRRENHHVPSSLRRFHL
jgi:xanthine dehydrogenase molybdopterin-binding subunit B